MAKGVARGNTKRVDGRKVVPKASGKAVDGSRKAFEARLARCSSMVSKLDKRLATLTNKACRNLESPELELVKKQADLGVKLRESWERAERRCQIALGIVMDRAHRAAKVAVVQSEEDEFAKIQREFEDGA